MRQKEDRTVVYRPEADRQKYTELPMPHPSYALWGNEAGSDVPGNQQFVEDVKVHLSPETISHQ